MKVRFKSTSWRQVSISISGKSLSILYKLSNGLMYLPNFMCILTGHTGKYIYIYIYIYEMKIIPTWPRASLPRFYQMALQDRIGQYDLEEL